MWVRSEYAGELAVLSAWLCALLPWSVSYGSGQGIRLIRVHFAYVYFQFAPGSGIANLLDTTVLVHDAAGFANHGSVAFGYELWALGAAVLTLAVLLSFAYYRLDDELEARSPVDPVRVMGGLLVAAALPLAAGTYLVHSGLVGFTVPVGVLFMFVLGGLLLLVERTDDVATAAVDEDAEGQVAEVADVEDAAAATAADGPAEAPEDDVTE